MAHDKQDIHDLARAIKKWGVSSLFMCDIYKADCDCVDCRRVRKAAIAALNELNKQ